MRDEDLQQIGQLITTRLDRAVETIAGEISAFRAETNARFEAIDRQFEAVHNRLDNAVAILTLL